MYHFRYKLNAAGNNQAIRKRADETQGLALTTLTRDMRPAAAGVIASATESVRRKESLQRGQGFALGLSSRGLGGGIVMNNSGLVTAEAAYTRDAIYDGRSGNEVCIAARSAATCRRNDRRADWRVRIGEAAFLIRRGSYNWIHQVRLVAGCQGTRQATQCRERGRKTVAPGCIVSHRRRGDGANRFRRRRFVGCDARTKQLRNRNGGNNQNDGNDYEKLD